MLNHLRKCPLWGDDVNELAEARNASTRLQRAESKATASSSSLPGPSSSRFQPYPNPLSRRVSSSATSFENLDPPLDQQVAPNDSASNVSGAVPGSHLSHQSSRPASRIGTGRHGPLGEPPRLEWSEDLKRQFERSLVKLIAACNLSFNFVEHPEWNSFCAEWIPGSPHVGRKPLSGRVLFDLVESFRAKTREEARGKMVTLQSDGWTSAFRTHLVAFLISIHATRQVTEVSKLYLITNSSKSRFIRLKSKTQQVNDGLPNIFWRT